MELRLIVYYEQTDAKAKSYCAHFVMASGENINDIESKKKAIKENLEAFDGVDNVVVEYATHENVVDLISKELHIPVLDIVPIDEIDEKYTFILHDEESKDYRICCLIKREGLGNVGIFEYDKESKCWGNVINDSLVLDILKRNIPYTY